MEGDPADHAETAERTDLRFRARAPGRTSRSLKARQRETPGEGLDLLLGGLQSALIIKGDAAII